MLDSTDWQGLRGTALYEQMFRNRTIIHVKSSRSFLETSDDYNNAIATIRNFLKDACKSFYYIDDAHYSAGKRLTIYVEADADAVMLKLKYDSENVDENDDYSPKKSLPEEEEDAERLQREILQKVRENQQRKQRDEKARAVAESEDRLDRIARRRREDAWAKRVNDKLRGADPEDIADITEMIKNRAIL